MDQPVGLSRVGFPQKAELAGTAGQVFFLQSWFSFWLHMLRCSTGRPSHMWLWVKKTESQEEKRIGDDRHKLILEERGQISEIINLLGRGSYQEVIWTLAFVQVPEHGSLLPPAGPFSPSY